MRVWVLCALLLLPACAQVQESCPSKGYRYVIDTSGDVPKSRCVKISSDEQAQFDDTSTDVPNEPTAENGSRAPANTGGTGGGGMPIEQQSTPVTPPPPPSPKPSCGSLSGAAGSTIDSKSGHCYVAWDSTKSWDNAQSDCESRAGTLVVMTSSGEESTVRGIMGGKDRWIGLSRGNNGDAFRWTTGEALSFTDWAQGQPATDDQLCADFDPSDGWHDRDCASKRPYVCEHNPK